MIAAPLDNCSGASNRNSLGVTMPTEPALMESDGVLIAGEVCLMRAVANFGLYSVSLREGRPVSYVVYGMASSGNCHKVKMALEHLRLPYQWREIDTLKGETRTPSFLAMNPNGQVPVLAIDENTFLSRVERNSLVSGGRNSRWSRKTSSIEHGCCSGCSSSSTATRQRSPLRASYECF